jgi:hypothetical protein
MVAHENQLRVEYRLTERALDLYPVIVGLMAWAQRHLDTDGSASRLELVHRTCGKPIDPREVELRLRGEEHVPQAAERQ